MKRTLLAAAVSVTASILLAAAGAKLLFEPQAQPAIEQQPAEESAHPEENGYYIAGYEGMVAVFRENDRDNPVMVFENVYLHSLPEYDRLKLESGVYAGNYTELASLLEDYIS